MKFRKLISALIASAMLASAFTAAVSAAVVFEYDEGYYIDNVLDVSERTPYIETTVTQLTSDQVVALKDGTSGLSNKKLKNTAGAFGDTSTWTVYRIDGTFKNVGELGAGYDRNDNKTAYIKIKALDATMDFSQIATLGAQNTDWHVTADTSNEATLGTNWTLQNDGTKRGVAINLVTPYPNTTESEENGLIDTDYSFTMYLVVPAGTSKTISYASANAGVQYWVGNAVEGVTSQLVENKVASRSSSFTIAEGPSTTAVTGVTLNTASLNFTVGDAAQTLTATVAPEGATDKSVTWTSSNTSVATVANGVVTPVAAGNATITVTTTDGSFTATCNVTVAAAPVPVSGVSLDKKTLSFTVGDAAQTLAETVAPGDADNKNVTWTSSNTSVATVADGVVTPAGAGKATITVTTEDGSFTDTCEVTVNPAPVASTGFKAIMNGAELSDLLGRPVTANENYGVGRISAAVDTSAYGYTIVAQDNNGESKEWAVPFGDVEISGGSVNFIAIVKSAAHVIKSIALKAIVK